MAYVHPAWPDPQRKRWMRENAHLWIRPDAYRFMPPGAPRYLGKEAVRYFWPEADTDSSPPPTVLAPSEASDAEFLQELKTMQRELDEARKLLAEVKRDLAFRRFQRKYSPDQPRDDQGRWTDTGAQYAQNVSPNGAAQDVGEFPPYIPPGVDIIENIKEAVAHKLDYPWFYDQVRNKGPWDYKQLDQEYADFGNFNYGATGKAAGFSEATLLRAAGWAQVQAGNSRPEWGTSVTLLEALLGIGGKAPFGDDPNDQLWISRGFKYYDAYNARR